MADHENGGPPIGPDGVNPAAATDRPAPNGPARGPKRVVQAITPDDQRRMNDRGQRVSGAALVMHPDFGVVATHCTMMQGPGGARVEVYNVMLVRDQDGQAKVERFTFLDESKLVRL